MSKLDLPYAGARAFAAMLAAIALSGCVMPMHAVSEGTEITAEELKWLRVGETTRAQVLERFGPPDVAYVEQRAIAYAWSGTRALVYPPSLVMMRRALMIRFDVAGKLAAFSIVDRPLAVSRYESSEWSQEPLMDWRMVLRGWLAAGDEGGGQAADRDSAIVVLRFKTEGSLPKAGTPWGAAHPLSDAWVFAVANEFTGWSFRQLPGSAPLSDAGKGSSEPERGPRLTGWLAFPAPRGTSYIATTLYSYVSSTPDRFSMRAMTAATPFVDHISVEPRSRDAPPRSFSSFLLGSSYSSSYLVDFIDEPRFAVEVNEPRTVLYAGTVVADLRCDESSLICPYDVRVTDESEFAQSFIRRHLGAASGYSMKLQLLTIPQSRSIEIRDRRTHRDGPGG